MKNRFKTFFVRLIALFIFNKQARKHWREQHLDLRPRDGIDIRKLSPEKLRSHKNRSREKHWYYRFFDMLVPATRAKIEHSERHILEELSRQNAILKNLITKPTNTRATILTPKEIVPATLDSPKSVPTKVTSAQPVPTKNTHESLNKLTKGDEGFFDRLKDKISKIPDSNGGRYYEKFPHKIGVICDQFYFDSVNAAANFIYLSSKGWEEKIQELQVLLVVSTWNGLKNGEWQGITRKGSPRFICAEKIIDACKERKIPVVFYSKEDPPSYNIYLPLAQKCDYIFTTAEECVEKYKADCGHDRVFVMRFGINPEFHNPIGTRCFPKESGVLFSGSWMEKFPERCNDLSMLFDGVLNANAKLKIIDRNYSLRDKIAYQFPDKYFRFASPSLEHDTLQKVHKLYDWAININSVKNSQTMFANRTYELQACGNLLISNYSIGVNSLLPTVFLITEKDEVGRILHGYSPEEIYEHQTAGVRNVMTGETCYDRIAEMLTTIGIEAKIPERNVLVIADEITEQVQEMFNNQSYSAKTLIPAKTANEEMLSQYDIVAFWHHEMFYGVFYLEDMINAFKYTACDYITKSAYMSTGTLVAGTEHNFVSKMECKYRSIFWRSAFNERLLTLTDNIALENGYSLDHFNYDATPTPKGNKTEYDLSVIVPVYNNAWHLYGKAFASLQRSSMFSKMKIILVDDGSTNELTTKMIKYLAETHSNVQSYFFPQGGSGSASRPRNKGVELAETRYITFLDPDDETICDGYWKLHQTAIKENADIAIGNIIRCDQKTMIFSYHSYIKKVTQSSVVENLNKGELLKKLNFNPVRIQAMVLKKTLIEENHIEQVVGAVGEDSLLSMQLLSLASKIVTLPAIVHVYYAANSGSIVNSIGINFFQKNLPCQAETLRWLEQNKLLSEYMKTRYCNYLKSWILRKLADAKEDEREQCAKLVYEICCLYEKHYNHQEPLINEFISLCQNEEYESAFWLCHDAFYPNSNN